MGLQDNVVGYCDIGQVCYSHDLRYTDIHEASLTGYSPLRRRYIVTQTEKWPPVTRGRPIPPESPIYISLSLQEPQSTPLSRLFESSILLDNVHTALHQPTNEVSFNIEEATLIVRTLTSFENVVIQTYPDKPKLFSSCLALSST